MDSILIFITNIKIDIDIIVNSSIGIALVSKVFPYLGKRLLHKMQPIKLSVKARTDLSKPLGISVQFPDHITQGFGKQNYNQRQPIKFYLVIATDHLRFPGLYTNYHPTVIVNWIDQQEKIYITSGPSFVANKTKRIGEFMLDIQRPQQISLDLGTREDWENIRDYEIYIQIYLDNKPALHKIVLNPTQR